jgi:hypothetical protein
LKANKVNGVVIAEMIKASQRTTMSAVSQASSVGTAAPHRAIDPGNSRPDMLTPAQLKAQEEATKRANPTVPIRSDEQESVPPPNTPSVEPIRDRASKAIDPLAPCKGKKIKEALPRK